MKAPTLLLLAGETSGDQHGSHVARELRARFPHARLLGTGGAAMEAEGVELLEGLDEMAVMGFAEVVSRLPFFWRLERRIRKLVESGEIDLVLPIDYPGFNLRVTEHAHATGVPVVFYIAPQVWAWKAGRTARLARATDRIAVILPFEEEIFRAEGGRAEYVGHPLLDRDDELPDLQVFSSRWGLDPSRPILALFPGSRKQEIRRHAGPFLAAGRDVQAARPHVQVVVARAPGLNPALLRSSWEGPEDLRPREVGDSRSLLRHARVALVKSGTSTLEAALEGTPFAVAYRTHPLTWQIARRVVRVDHVALANLVAGRGVVPEFLQSDVSSRVLTPALLELLDDTPAREKMLRELAGIRERLGSPGAARRVAELVAEVLEERAVEGRPPSDPTRGSRS